MPFWSKFTVFGSILLPDLLCVLHCLPTNRFWYCRATSGDKATAAGICRWGLVRQHWSWQCCGRRPERSLVLVMSPVNWHIVKCKAVWSTKVVSELISELLFSPPKQKSTLRTEALLMGLWQDGIIRPLRTLSTWFTVDWTTSNVYWRAWRRTNRLWICWN